MTPEGATIIILVVSNVAMALSMISEKRFYLAQIQTLIDKVKATSFESYARAKEPTPPRVKLDSDPAEDLGSLAEFNVQI
jgi:hypothetical protein